MKKYDISKLYIGEVGKVNIKMANINSLSLNKALIKEVVGVENKLYLKNNDRCVDLITGSEILDWNKEKDREIAFRGDLVMPNNHKEIKFKDYMSKFDMLCGKSNLSLEEIQNFLLYINKSSIYDVSETLAIIKPDGMPNIDKIVEMFYNNGLKIKKYKIENLNEELVDEHYSHLLDMPFYPDLKKFMMSAPVAIMILEGEDAVSKLRNLMGPTDSTKASKKTIRGMFGTDKMYNAIHGSDSDENAYIEINRFFKTKTKTK